MPAATVVISLSLGFLAAYALHRRTPLNRWLDPLLMLPLGASAVTLGLGFIIVFNRPPFDLRSLPVLIPVAHSLVALPFVVRTLQPALAAIPRRLRQSAAVLGASPWRVWLEVDLPIIAGLPSPAPSLPSPSRWVNLAPPASWHDPNTPPCRLPSTVSSRSQER